MHADCGRAALLTTGRCRRGAGGRSRRGGVAGGPSVGPRLLSPEVTAQGHSSQRSQASESVKHFPLCFPVKLVRLVTTISEARLGSNCPLNPNQLNTRLPVPSPSSSPLVAAQRPGGSLPQRPAEVWHPRVRCGHQVLAQVPRGGCGRPGGGAEVPAHVARRHTSLQTLRYVLGGPLASHEPAWGGRWT